GPQALPLSASAATVRGLRGRRATPELVLTAPDVDDDLVPSAVLRPLDEFVELAAGRGKAGVAVPGFPVGARSPRADDHPLARLALRAKELSADPTRSLLRGRHTVAHHGIPLILGPGSHSNVGHDRHH